MSSIKKHLTPTDTEEVKPNLFIRRTKKGYRQVHPIVWDGNYRWREQLRTVFTFRTFFTLVLIIFLAWSYLHDTRECFNVLENIIALCEDNPQLCVTHGFIYEESLGREVIHEENTNTLRIPFEKD